MDAFSALQDSRETAEADVTRLGSFGQSAVSSLLERYGLELKPCTAGEPIPGSYWGDDEAGLVGSILYARPDTPVHSILHEASHFICMDEARRSGLHTDAGGDDLEECAVCYLQIVLARRLPGFGAARMMADMDRWGYSFRLGATRAWFENDAEDARRWLREHGLLRRDGEPTFRRRA